MEKNDLLDHLVSDGRDPRRAARSLYWAGYSVKRISELVKEKANTIHSWKRRDKWDETSNLERINGVIEAQLIFLVAKPSKTGGDFKEIDLLSRQIERTARIEKYKTGGNEADLNPNIANRNAKPKSKPKINLLTDEQIEKMNELFHDGLYEHQKTWYRAGIENRIRNINKSRQIGATMYFSQEGAIDAINTGRNQIFLSASKSQAFQSRQYIIDFFHGVDIDLKGEVIHFPHNDARLYFLGTNSKTAQSYHGNLYLDEYFWINKFLELRKVASGMSSQKRWRQTYYSTPSSINHEAYKFWTGELFNKGRKKDDRIKIDVSHKALKLGKHCVDNQWRQIVTIDDAERMGFDLFDVEQLKLEYSPDEFANLFLCQFIDDSSSTFPLADLQPCFVDSWEAWTDFKPFATRPLADKPVWVGYDPAHTGDSAGCSVVAPPAVNGGKFRVIEKHQWHGMDFAAQAESIKKITQKYNVTYIGIDATGIGEGVYQLVKEFFPRAVSFKYSIEVKQGLIMKMQDILRKRRLEFDAGWSDLAQAFMSIRKTLTQSQRFITYVADRSDETSHADIAWATMHAIYNEPLTSSNGANSQKGIIEVF